MKRRTLIASIGAVAGTTLGAAAYTSATVTRDAAIGVQTDQNGLIQLTPSSTFSQITEKTSGELSINFTDLNVGSEFVFGDAAAPGTTNAFSFVQNDSDRDFTFEYALASGSDPSTETNVQFEIFTDDGNGVVTSQGIVTEGGSTKALTFATTATTTYYVVLTINTAGVDQSTSLDGTLKISA